jgi:hypothetical protein
VVLKLPEFPPVAIVVQLPPPVLLLEDELELELLEELVELVEPVVELDELDELELLELLVVPELLDEELELDELLVEDELQFAAIAPLFNCR